MSNGGLFSTIFILIILGAIGYFGYLYVLKIKSFSNSSDSFYKQKPILTPNEFEFFGRLVQALPDYHIFPQVALGALLQPTVNPSDKKGYYKIRGTFAQKIADFVVCNKELKVIAIIELDDKTHNQDKDGKRDAMLAQANYKVIRWNSKSKPTVDEIRQKFTYNQ